MAEIKFEVDKENLEVRITRVFDAPIKRVWQAYTNSDHLAQWWHNTTIETNELKAGGAWKFIDHGKNGDENHVFSGEYLEIEEPNKLKRTFEYEPWARHVMEETVLLEDHGHQTAMTTISKYKNLDDLEGMVGSGMERGAIAGIERLAKLVEKS